MFTPDLKLAKIDMEQTIEGWIEQLRQYPCSMGIEIVGSDRGVSIFAFPGQDGYLKIMDEEGNWADPKEIIAYDATRSTPRGDWCCSDVSCCYCHGTGHIEKE